MRKVIALEFVSLDGVIQSPGSPDEDPSDGFTRGGWIAAYSDPVLGEIISAQMSLTFDLLLGRRTFDIWAAYWPQHADQWPGAMRATKYVATHTHPSQDWQPSVLLNGDVAEAVSRLKREEGPDMHVYGSSSLLQTLLEHDLVDAFWLKLYPVTLGGGKGLFTDRTIPAAFRLTEGRVCPSGVIVANYERAGALKTGDL